MLEEKYHNELSLYKVEFEKRVQEDLQDLEEEKNEKLARIKELDQTIAGFAARIGQNGPLDISNLQTIYENKLRDLNNGLSKKVRNFILKFYN